MQIKELQIIHQYVLIPESLKLENNLFVELK